jgi:hypothetical protein
LLLNIALWAKHYNKDVKTIDPTKKPAVLYLTLENSIDETIERLWSYYVSEEDEIEYHTPAEAFDILREKGFNDEGVHIEIRYRPTGILTTDDISAMLDDMYMDGFEPIMVVVDYIKRLKSVEKQLEYRFELGEIINQLTTLSKVWNLPVITAAQMNREALRMADEGKVNAGKRMGSAQIGESTLILENTDYSFIVAREERKSTGNQYLTIKNNASRGKTGAEDYVTYFAHPFENGMRLKEDQDLAITYSLADLGDDLSNFDPTGSNDSSELPTEKRRLPGPLRNKRPKTRSSFTEITGSDDDDEEISI